MVLYQDQDWHVAIEALKALKMEGLNYTDVEKS